MSIAKAIVHIFLGNNKNIKMLIAIVIAATATKRKVKIKRIDPAVFSKFSRGVQLRVAKQEQLSIAWKYGKQSLTPKLSLPLVQNIYSIIIHIFPQSTGPPMDLLTQLVCEIHNSWKKKIELKKIFEILWSCEINGADLKSKMYNFKRNILRRK